MKQSSENCETVSLFLMFDHYIANVIKNLQAASISQWGGEGVSSVKWGGGIVSLLITMDHSAPVANKQLQSWEYVGRIYHAKASDRAKT